jgi:putative ABC transport system permease protein
MDLPARIFRALMFAYPAEFRHEYGTEMELAFAERLQNEPKTRVWFAALRDLLIAAPREHLHILRGDLQYAVRIFAKSPAFTLMAVLTMAMGIGANTAIFSLVNAVLLRSLPYGDPSRLAYIWTPNDHFKAPVPRELSPTDGDFFDFQRLSHSFSDMSLFSPTGFRMEGGDHIEGAVVGENFFRTLGVKPELGRTIEPEDGRVVVISHEIWLAKFAGDSHALGQSLRLDGKPYSVIGVMPPSFHFPSKNEVPDSSLTKAAEVWIPVVLTPKEKADHDGNCCDGVLARLSPGVSFKQAQAEMSSLMVGIDKKHAQLQGWSVWVAPFIETIVGPVRTLIWMLMGSVSLVLLIACGNIANLLMARAAGRVHEMGVRSALGAERTRLIRQMVTEAMVLAGAGGAIGVLFASAGVRLLLRLNPGDIPRIDETTVDGRVLLFSIASSIVTGFLFGLLPAISSSRIDVMALLKRGGSKGSVGTSNGLRHALIVAEVALSVILLAGAGLLIRSYLVLQASGTGFSSTPLSMRVDMDLAGNPQLVQKRHAFFRELLTRIESLPGVRRAALVDNLPLTHSESVTFMEVEGNKEKAQAIDMRLATPAYFPAMGIRLIEGRLFDDRDIWGQPTHLLVTQEFVKRFFAGKSPLGGRIKFPTASEDSRADSRVIVGVVSDVKHGSLEEIPRAEIFGSIWQWGGGCCAHVVVDASGRQETQAAAMRQIARSIDPSVTVSEVRSMEEIISAANAGRRFQTSLLSIFAAIAMLLALVGIYGLTAYSVRQRTPEFGIRMTLGASRVQVLAMVLRQGIGLTAFGVAIGIGGALVLTRLLSASLYGVKATDPLTFCAVPALILVVSAVACLAPAWKATRIDPAIALRYE